MRNALPILVATFAVPAFAGEKLTPSLSGLSLKNSEVVAKEVDRLINKELAENSVKTAGRSSDEDFLRRVTLDLTGKLPSANEVTLFALNSDPKKREKLVAKLLKTDAFAVNWSRYWRDVIFTRATEQRARLAIGGFEDWMKKQLKENSSWSSIATQLLTATGDVRENGATGLLVAHSGDASEVAAEVSRIFLGIQIQCANCHDHPTDKWKREDFHQLAAFFPRVRMVPVRENNRLRSFAIRGVNSAPRRRGNLRDNLQLVMRRFDRNRDNKLTKNEVQGSPLARQFDRILQIGDGNKDGAISIEEFKKLPQPMNQRNRQIEHYMPNLADPGSRGKEMPAIFFVSRTRAREGSTDATRRNLLAGAITAEKNPWFARAYVNRMWAELVGEGFVMPIDDMGPGREARYPKAFDTLAAGFAASGYDTHWLFRTITSTQIYQRQIAVKSTPDEIPFAASRPTRLRADQIFDSLGDALGIDFDAFARRGGNQGARRRFGLRAQFNTLFGFDPSTPQEDITGNVPQALFLMNSPLLNNAIRAVGNTKLNRILSKYSDDEDAVAELYLSILSREPSERELKICKAHIKQVGKRGEAFEDLMWSLINSSEFLSKR